MSNSSASKQNSTTARQDLSAAKSTTELLRGISDEDPIVRALVNALDDSEFRDRMPNNHTLRVTAQKIVDTAAELKRYGLAVYGKTYAPEPGRAHKRLYLQTAQQLAHAEAAENITLKEASEMLDVSVQGLLARYINQRIWDWSDSRGIRGEKTDKGWHVNRSSVEAYLKKKTLTEVDAAAQDDLAADGCIDFVQYQVLDGHTYTPMSHRACRELCDDLLVSAREHHASPGEPVLSKMEWDFYQVERDRRAYDDIYNAVSAKMPEGATQEDLIRALRAAEAADPYYQAHLVKKAELEAAIKAKKSGE